MRTLSLALIALIFASTACAQETKSLLSSHILDLTAGKPASGVKITLSKQDEHGAWSLVEEKHTDENGRVSDFLRATLSATPQGIYKLTFHTAPYFKALGQESFYPFVEVVFVLKDDSHYHVPITLSPFGYSTYRGN